MMDDDELKKKQELIEEEKAACDTPLDARIHTAELPPQTAKEVEAAADALYKRFADVFSSYEDAEYFSMLPLDKQARMKVINRAREIDREARTSPK